MSSDHTLPSGAPPGLSLLKILAAGLFAAGIALLIGDKSAKILLLAPLVFIGLAASIRYPLVALAGLTVMIVTNMSQNLIVSFDLPSIAKLAAPGLFTLLAARWFIYRDVPYIGWLATACLVALFALKLLSATYAAHWETSLKLSIDFTKDAIVALLALAFMSQRRGIETFTVTAVLAVAVICALGVYQLIFGNYMGGFRGFALVIGNSGRFSGPLGDANFFASIIVFTVPLALFQFLNARGILRGIGWMIVTGLLVVGLLATQSRGGLIGLAVALAALGTGLTLRQLLTFGLAALVAVLLVTTFTSDAVIERFSTIFGTVTAGEVQDTSTEGRLASWQVALKLFSDHPLLGVGVGNFKPYYQDIALELGLIFRGEGRSTHSLYLEILAEQGLAGILLLSVILIVAARSIFMAVRLARMANDDRLARHIVAFGAGCAGYLMAMTFLQDSFPRFLWLVIALALEMQHILQTRLSAENTDPIRSP
ncbi:O-antigen ligase family protein [Limimaricola cinnabarinus]|uniref:O-antigen ligase-related domain-containing protein n=1 Tax=Limimaricola cinnabarinus LL-001 TaxID=1337093 RepID=U2Z578_9RHOB|nr:O-antigen ligase family protein [Limimaricola cinnabarinus]GAD56227.1 hypothetical protein MBELCI_2279 [Limimaricola cinnabarinus LL-001]